MTGLTPDDLAEVDRLLARADAEATRWYPGDPGDRQPVHTVYVPADRVTPTLVADHGAAARAALAAHAPDPETLAAVVDADPAAVAEAWPLLLAKLTDEPVEDLRIDLEDGYRGHTTDEEDADVVAAVRAVSGTAGAAPPYWGVRFECLEPTTRVRGLRTLDLALGTALEAGPLPDGFRLTLPKVTSSDQAHAMAVVCERLESAHGLPAGRLRFEVQVETPQAVLSPHGAVALRRILEAADGRCSGLHFGTYDYTAALGVGAAHQALDHPAADLAKDLMVLATAGTGVPVSDGSTNRLPVGSRGDVHAGWATHYRLVTRALERGLWQGWDLHPAQLVTRHLATIVFHRAGLPAATARLRAYLTGDTGDAGLTGAVLDEPATATALAGVLRRGLLCGAVTEAELTAQTGAHRTTLDALALRRIGR